MFDCTTLGRLTDWQPGAAAPAVAEPPHVADSLALLRRALLCEHKGRVAVVSSFGAESAVLLALVAEIDPATPVLFVDTRQHFPETLAYRETLARTLRLSDVRSIGPTDAALIANDPGAELWRYDPDAYFLAGDLAQAASHGDAAAGVDAADVGSSNADDGVLNGRAGGLLRRQRGAVDGFSSGTELRDETFAHTLGGLDAMAAIAQDAVGDLGHEHTALLASSVQHGDQIFWLWRH